MAYSLDAIREHLDVTETARDKGLTLTLRISAYDKGMLNVNGVPINDEGDKNLAWLKVDELIAGHKVEFQKLVFARINGGA
jgi:hypothetical protein